MVEHINGIVSAMAGKTDADIVSDYASTLALERAVEIISEAARHGPTEIRNSEPDVP